ncbi:MAG: hypothetical protein PWQ25_1830 [Deferribacteres bacterium]|nr:hypothetical protein [Deferribacteres bacterium]
MIKILKRIFDNVRVKNKAFSTTYRCDNDNYIRLFRLDIIPLDSSKIKLEHTLIDQRQRVTSLENFKQSSRIVTMCAWCNKILCNDQYVEIDEAVNNLKLFEDEGIPKFSHGICDSCKSVLEKEIEDFILS